MLNMFGNMGMSFFEKEEDIVKPQEEMGQEVVQRLVSGVLGAYNDLNALDGIAMTQTAEGGLFRGVAKQTFTVSSELEGLIGNLIGFTLSSRINPERAHVQSTIYDGLTNPENIDAFFDTYSNQMDNVEADFLEKVKQDKIVKTEQVEQFKKGMTELNESYKTGKVSDVAYAVEALSAVANWGQKVVVKPIYDSLNPMRILANEMGANFGITDATNLARDILSIEQSTMAEQITIKTNWLYSEKEIVNIVKPDESQIYTKGLDHELVAMDLMRMNQQKSYEKKD